jgi:hypothetical protein
MKESEFVGIFKEAAVKIFKGQYVVETGANLLYELFLDENLDIAVPDYKNPKRGYSAFQTDVCIFEPRDKVLVPRVAIEFKTTITTHDILTYSAKAGKHKTIYPSLRYGVIASNLQSIPARFFIHNDHLDFFIAAETYKTTQLKAFIKKLINAEVGASKELEKLYLNKDNFNYYRSTQQLTNFEL